MCGILLLGRPLTFGDIDQINFIKEQEQLKDPKFLKEKILKLETDIEDIDCDISSFEDEIRMLNSQKREKEKELSKMENLLIDITEDTIV